MGHLLVPVLLGMCVGSAGMRAWEARKGEAGVKPVRPAVTEPAARVSQLPRPTPPRG